MNTKTDKNYEAPKLEVTRVVTEGIIAQSTRFTEDLDWKPDPDAPAEYDGDIWVNF
jgi:hypothetical protein